MKQWVLWVGILIAVLGALVVTFRFTTLLSTVAPPDPFTIDYGRKPHVERARWSSQRTNSAESATLVTAEASVHQAPLAAPLSAPADLSSAPQLNSTSQVDTPPAGGGNRASVRHYPVTWTSPGYSSCRRLFYTSKRQAASYGGLGLILGLLFTCVVGKVSVRLITAEGTLARQRVVGVPEPVPPAKPLAETHEPERNILTLLWRPMVDNPGTFLVVLGAVLGPASYYALSRSSTAASAAEAATRAMGKTDDLEMHTLCAEAEATWIGSKAETNSGFISHVQQSAASADGGQP